MNTTNIDEAWSCWYQLRDELSRRISETDYISFISGLSAYSIDSSGRLLLLAPSEPICQAANDKYLETIQNLADSEAPGLGITAVRIEMPRRQQTFCRKTIDALPLDPAMTLDSYIPETGNRGCFDAAHRFSKDPDSAALLTVLAAPSGCGKTHLLNAIKNELVERIDESEIAIMSSTWLINTLRTNAPDNGHRLSSYELTSQFRIVLYDYIHYRSPYYQDQVRKMFMHLLKRGRKVVIAVTPAGWESALKMLGHDPALKELALKEMKFVRQDLPLLDTKRRIAQNEARGAGVSLSKSQLEILALRCLSPCEVVTTVRLLALEHAARGSFNFSAVLDDVTGPNEHKVEA